MIVIPTEQIDEWDSEYDRLQLSKQVSRISFMAHCAAVWGYDQGLTAMDQLFRTDPELE
jgi:hypothetical protein